MKKLVAILIAVCTVFALTSAAFAATDATAEAYKMTEFNLDGKLDEFKKDSPLVLDQPEQVVRDIVIWKGPEDLSATFYLGWDEEYIYIGAEITEDTPYGAIETLPLDGIDNIELFLSTNPADDPDRTEYATNDFMIYLSMDGEYWDNAIDRSMVPKDNRQRFISQGMDNGESVLEGYECASVQTATGFTWEGRIPWACFSNNKIEVYTPQAGDELNFNILVTDIDYPCPGTEYIPQIAWTGTQEMLVSPNAWGRITLAE